jgi:hypothetical protein
MPLDQPLYTRIRLEMESRRAAAIEEAERYGRRVRAGVWAVTLLWYVLGVGLILLSYHIPSMSWGNVALWGGLTVCSACPFFTWVVAYTIGRDQGLWS